MCKCVREAKEGNIIAHCIYKLGRKPIDRMVFSIYWKFERLITNVRKVEAEIAWRTRAKRVAAEPSLPPGSRVPPRTDANAPPERGTADEEDDGGGRSEFEFPSQLSVATEAPQETDTFQQQKFRVQSAHSINRQGIRPKMGQRPGDPAGSIAPFATFRKGNSVSALPRFR